MKSRPSYHDPRNLELFVQPASLKPEPVMPVPVIQRRGKLPSKFLGQPVPTIILHSGEAGMMRFLEFFTARIRNKNTRLAYAQAVGQFLRWCDKCQLTLADLNPIVVAGYIEAHAESAPTIKQHLAAIRKFFDYLVLGHIVVSNSAAAVQGPQVCHQAWQDPCLESETGSKTLG